MYMKGNLRPPPTIMANNNPMLPSARIHCDSTGWVKVGDRTYLSSTDALLAYMQQFDSNQTRTGAGSVNGSGLLQSAASGDAAHRYSSAGGGGRSAPPSRSSPANVSGLLMSNPGDVTVTPSGLNGLSSTFPAHVLGSSATSRHSVSFSVPDTSLFNTHPNTSRLSASVSALDSRPVLNSSHLSQSASTYRPNEYLSSSMGASHQVPHSLGASLFASTPSSLPPHSSTAHSQHLGSSSLDGLLQNGYSSGSSHSGHSPRSADGQLNPAYAVGGKRAKSEVEVLLTTNAPTDRDIRKMSEDALREVKLKRLLKEAGERSLQKQVNEEEEMLAQSVLKEACDRSSQQSQSSNNSTKSSLQQEVEEALTRSAQLLETIKTDALVSPRCVSDTGSLSTEVLLSVNPYSTTDAINSAVGMGRQSRSRHRYSYHTPGHQTRSVSTSRMASSLEQQRFVSLPPEGRRRSVDSLRMSPLSALQGDSRADMSSSASVSAASDSEDMSRKSPRPSSSKSPRTRPAGGPPSWIQELIPPAYSKQANGTNQTDSVFSARDPSGGRKAPSWVNGLEQHSDIASSVDTQDLRDAADSLAMGGARKRQTGMNGADDTADSSYRGPGLNYSDLVTTPTKHKVSFSDQPPRPARPSTRLSRNNSFGGVSSSNGSFRSGLRKDRDKSKPPITMSGRFYQDLAGVEVTRPKTNTPTNLSASLGSESPASLLRKKVSGDSVQAWHKMDSFLAQLDCEDSPGAARVSTIPRCSSAERLNGTGHDFDVPSDITGASPIAKGSNFSSRLVLDDPTLTPARHSKASAGYTGLTSGDGDANISPDDLLDGDRSWEKATPSYKAPVHVGNSSPNNFRSALKRPETPTLSGGQQPGSMETLKQMLFRLQNEESSTSSPAPDHKEDDGATELIPGLKDYDFEVEPGGQSLERALVHLSRLKTLVAAGTASSTEHAT